MEKKSKPRSQNYTSTDVDNLVEIALRYTNIIENKFTDAQTNDAKTKAWNQIASEYNALYSVSVCDCLIVCRSRPARNDTTDFQIDCRDRLDIERKVSFSISIIFSVLAAWRLDTYMSAVDCANCARKCCDCIKSYEKE